MAAGHVVDCNMSHAQSLAVEFMTYDGCNFDFSVRKCCVLSQMCAELNSVPALFIHLAQLHLIFYQLKVKMGQSLWGKVKVNCSKFTKNRISIGCDCIFNFSD